MSTGWFLTLLWITFYFIGVWSYWSLDCLDDGYLTGELKSESRSDYMFLLKSGDLFSIIYFNLFIVGFKESLCFDDFED